MKITISYKNRKLFNVSMQNDMTVKRLREIIEETHQIPPEVQTLTFNGHVLENGKMLMRNYGVHDQATVTLSLPIDFHLNFKIYVKMPGGLMIKRRVNKDDLVSKLKWSIEDATKIPVALQALSYGSWLMEDGERLGEYDLHHGSVVRVLRRPNPVQIPEFDGQLPRYRIPAKDGLTSEVDDGIMDLLLKRPSPIKRTKAYRLNESKRGDMETFPTTGFEMIEPTAKEASRLTSSKEASRVTSPKELSRVTSPREASRVTSPKELSRVTSPKELSRLTSPKELSRVTTPKELSRLTSPKVGDGESLRLDLPDTEAYRKFCQALEKDMASKKADGSGKKQ
ncbi:unnamed protein product [Mesocestoides corti]|uniref:Ubiquitin-like domain-containing protein n=1 Tax=Mesocestoides corti TaxID=53468 RepID=A0A0R3UMS1_MESCO|nr:unnamed protein product [Mesocestoides corti]